MRTSINSTRLCAHALTVVSVVIIPFSSMRSVAIKIGMPPTIGASLGLTGPMDTGAFTSYFIYSQFTVDFNSFMANFELRMSVFQFSNGEQQFFHDKTNTCKCSVSQRI